MEDVLLDDHEPEHGSRGARKDALSAKRDDGLVGEDEEDTSKRKRPGAWRAMLQIRWFRPFRRCFPSDVSRPKADGDD